MEMVVIRDVTQFESDCCWILTIFCKAEKQWIFRLIWIQIWIHLTFWKARVLHSLQSAISRTRLNKHTLNSYLLMSIQTKYPVGVELLVQFGV